MNKEHEDMIVDIIIAVFSFAIILGLYFVIKKNDKKQDDNTIINTTTKKNDSIKLELNKLDSLKNVEVNKVKTLDNDSTLELFYVLIRE